jgi:DNA (cytosine-5)-methyltransferase 1
MSVANHKKGNEMARNSLVVESIKLVDEIRPKFFIFENVRAFLNSFCTDFDGKDKRIRETIELNLGGKYNIQYQTINFKNYGNPSSRTRTVVIGVRKDIQEITPLDFIPKLQKEKTIRKTIGGLPSLNNMGEIYEKDIYHNFRPYAKHMLSWIDKTKEGESAFDNKNPKRRPHKIIDGKIVFNKRKNGDKYSRCFWDDTGKCIHTRNDIFASQSTIHPSDNRVFSIRELMKLMSIPDSFRWSSISENKLNDLPFEQKQKFLKKEEINIRQSIGEAVPTIIFQQIAKHMKKVIQERKINERDVERIIEEENLDNLKTLKIFLKKNLKNYSFSELSKIAELSNAHRLKHAAYYTRQDICFTIIKDLPNPSVYKKLVKILEPSVGTGNFLPLLIEKYKSVPSVQIDVMDIDKNAIDILRILIKKINIPKNIKINYLNEDFLLKEKTSSAKRNNNKYDIIVGNPPFGKITENKDLLREYRENKKNIKTSNLFSFFLEKSLSQANIVALIIPKSFLSAPEFNDTRKLVSSFLISKIVDYGEKGFKGVKIETISLVINTKTKNVQNKILIESYIKNQTTFKYQDYICSNDFPSWLIYRSNFFDKIASKLQFNIFSTYRDRQITKKITKLLGKVRVLKSRNIGNTKIINIPNYDSYVDDYKSLSISKYINSDNAVLVPNLTYNPRACFLP